MWLFYKGRANAENMIKAAIGFGPEASASHCCGGNAAYFQIGVLTYNLISWFKDLALGQKKTMIKWVRSCFFPIAGKPAETGHYLILRLCESHAWREEYQRAEAGLESYSLPGHLIIQPVTRESLLREKHGLLPANKPVFSLEGPA